MMGFDPVSYAMGAKSGGGGGGLPEVSAADNGDVLTVVDGAWAKAAPSGGGGVLVVNADMQTGTLDKTWQEIYDADYPVVTGLFDKNDKFYMTIEEVLVDTKFEPATYLVNVKNSAGDVVQFKADSADGYPVVVHDPYV